MRRERIFCGGGEEGGGLGGGVGDATFGGGPFGGWGQVCPAMCPVHVILYYWEGGGVWVGGGGLGPCPVIPSINPALPHTSFAIRHPLHRRTGSETNRVGCRSAVVRPIFKRRRGQLDAVCALCRFVSGCRCSEARRPACVRPCRPAIALRPGRQRRWQGVETSWRNARNDSTKCANNNNLYSHMITMAHNANSNRKKEKINKESKKGKNTPIGLE